jgi:hypothetical protein
MQAVGASGAEANRTKTKLFVDNPFICETPSPTTVVDIDGKLLLLLHEGVTNGIISADD